MSDETVATTEAAAETVDEGTIEAPSAAEPVAEAQTAEAPKGTEAAPKAPKTRAEARRQAIKAAKDLAPKVAEAAKERALRQPREEAGKPEGGQFKAEGEQESAPGAEDAATVASEQQAEAADVAEADSTDSEPTEAAKVADDGLVSVPIPDGHPLREQGKDHVKVPAESERDIRAILNAAARSRDLERVQEDKARLEARLNALQGDLPNPKTDPTISELLRQIEEAEGFGPELRAKVEAAFGAQAKLAELQAEREAMQGVWMQRQVSTWASEVDMEAANKLSVWAESGELGVRLPAYKQEYLRNLDAHNERLPEGSRPIQPTTDHFFQWLGAAYKQDPRVQAKLTKLQQAEKEAEEARIRAKVLADVEKKKAAEAEDAKQRHSARPPISSPQSTQAPTAPDDDSLGEAARSPNRRRALRQRVREIGEQYVRG